jgi:methanethiol S-methyltransferase
MDNATASSSPAVSKPNVVTAIVSILVYLYFFPVFLLWVGFLAPYRSLPSSLEKIVPYNIETSPVSETNSAAIIDTLLLGAFIVPHSFFARTSVKKRMGLPKTLERSFFVLQAAIFMHLQIHFWQSIDGPALWNVQSNDQLSGAILAVFLSAFLFLFSATFAIDHFSLFGLTQAFGVDINNKIGLGTSEGADGFVVRWHYSIVAHPIMTGVLIMCWATPLMTISRLLFAGINTAWILGAVFHLEGK